MFVMWGGGISQITSSSYPIAPHGLNLHRQQLNTGVRFIIQTSKTSPCPSCAFLPALMKGWVLSAGNSIRFKELIRLVQVFEDVNVERQFMQNQTSL